MSNTVFAYSFDMDDCLFYEGVTSAEGIVDHHTALFDEMQQNPYKKYIYMGSRRQSYDCDIFNSTGNRTPLAIATLPHVAAHTGSILNKLLFADIVRSPTINAERYGIQAANEMSGCFKP